VLTEYQNSLRWLNENGLFLPMLLDAKRNRFYDNILRENVKDRCCVDIGFGTGILSILALKHGAKHVLAFESNYRRFLLGQHIIEQLHLGDRIELVHEKFHKNMTERIGSKLVFHEIVGDGIWSEGLYHCMNTQYNMIPNEYELEIVVAVDQKCRIEREVEIVGAFNIDYGRIKDSSWPSVASLSDLKNLPHHIQHEIYHVHNIHTWLPYFNLDLGFNMNLGIDIDQNWKNLISNICKSNFKNNQGFYDDRFLINYHYNRLKPTSLSVGHVTVSAKTMTATILISGAQPQLIDIVQNPYLRIVIPKTVLPKKNCVLIMIPKMRHGTHQLTLLKEDYTDHWGGPITCIIDTVTTDVELFIDLNTGKHRISPV